MNSTLSQHVKLPTSSFPFRCLVTATDLILHLDWVLQPTGVLLAGPFSGAVVQRATLLAENVGDGKSFVAFIGNDKVNVFTGPDCDSTIGICVRVNDVAPESIENLKFLFSASENLQALGLIIAYSVKCGCLDDTLPGLVEFLDSVIEQTGFAAQADALTCGNKRLKPGKGPFGKL